MGRARHRRFFVPAERIRAGCVEFTSAQAHQLTDVLRLGPGDQVWVFDGSGREIVAVLAAAPRGRATARIIGEAPPLASPRLAVTLAQVVPRGPAMDLIVAKTTELGVARIVPLEGERSVRRASARAPRWSRIAEEAAEQCGRRDVPEVAATCTVVDFLRGHGRDAPLLACEAGEGSRPLPAVCRELQGTASLTLLIGGEGGLSPAEVERLRSQGARLSSLGPRLLRADTAALAALAVIQACLGDWEVRPGGETDGRSVS